MAASKIIGIDLGTTNSVVAVMEGGEPGRHPQPGGEPDHPLGRRVHQGGRAAGRRAGQAPGGHQPQADHLLDQAVHGPPARTRSAEEKLVPYKVVGGPQRPRGGRDRRQAVHPARDLGDDPAQAQGDRRGLPRPHGAQGGHHRAGLLQRRPAAGHQGRRPDRRPRGASGSSTSRPPRRWPTASTRRRNEKIAVFDLGGGTFDISILDLADGVFEVQAHQRRHPPGRRRLRRGLIDWLADEFKKEQGIDLRKDPMALQRLKEAAEKAKKDLSSTTPDRHQPAVHHGRPVRAQAPEHDASPAPSSSSWSTT